MDLQDEIRSYWDADAPTYDLAPHHHPTSPVVMAAWTGALERLLPSPPARVVDCGAGTGFLSLIASRLGHRVTAIDLAPAMLERLREHATREGLAVEVVEGPAERPTGTFDVVMERHLVWTLPEPGRALAAWRTCAPGGRLVLVESVWGSADALERARAALRGRLRRWRGRAPEHHADYGEPLRASLPLASGTPPDRLVELAAAAGWRNSRMVRLRDVDWAERRELPLPERLVGLPPRFAVVADG